MCNRFYNNNKNSSGPYSWEDWAQRTVEQMNWMFEQSVYPLAPQGVLTRVRLDNIIVVPDDTLFTQYAHAPNETIYDGRWGFSVQEYLNPPDYFYDIGWWVIHELGHYLLGRVDLYALDVQSGDVKVLDDSGQLIAGTPLLPCILFDVVYYNRRIYDVMHVPDPYSLFSDYHAYSLNRDWPQGQRTHQGWDYIYGIPNETKLRILDRNGHQMPNVEVTVYEAVPGDGSSGPYNQSIDNIPDIVGVTDSQGLFSLGAQPFGNLKTYGITAGVDLVKLKDLTSGKYRYIWLELTDLNLAFWRGETTTYIHDVHFPDGPKELHLSKNEVTFVARQGENPTPQNVEVEILGEGLQYWSVLRSSAPWLRTIPSPDIATSYKNYPSEPLTLIVDSASLPIGTYTTHLNIDGGENVLDSPQTITVTLTIVPFN